MTVKVTLDTTGKAPSGRLGEAEIHFTSDAHWVVICSSDGIPTSGRIFADVEAATSFRETCLRADEYDRVDIIEMPLSTDLDGLKLIGFGVWERRGGGGRNVTFPARSYSVNGERRSFSLLRPITDTNAQQTIRQRILDATELAEQQQATL